MNHSLFFYLHSFSNNDPVFDWFVVFISKYFGWIIIFFAFLFVLLKIHSSLFNKKGGMPSLYSMTFSEYGMHLGAGLTTLFLRALGVNRVENVSSGNISMGATLDYSMEYLRERKREFEKRKYAFFVIATSAIVSWTTSLVLKIIFSSSRPFVLFTDINSLIDYGWNDSFPSGHAMFFSALATSIFFYYKKVGSVYIIFAFLIGIARVVAGIHFPVDVIFGWFFGVLVAVLVRFFFFKTKIIPKKEIDISLEKE